MNSSVPANKITIKTPYGSYDINTPKNVDITRFFATVNTNGAVNISFDKWTATNDPAVIDKAGAARVAELNAWNSLISSVAYSSANGAVQGATRP